MASRDISFYKYLEAAFRYRLFNPQGLRATLSTRFSYPGYNLPFSRIFYYARRVLPSFYRTKFPDTEEGNLQMARTMLQKLDQHQDLELERCFDPATTPQENIPVIEEARQESTVQQPPAAAPAAAGPLPGVGIRPPSIPRMPAVKLTKAPEQPETIQKTTEQTGPAIKRRFNFPGFRPPASLVNTLKNFGSNFGVFFKKNVGKYITAGRIATVVSSGIGAVVGAGLTNSSPAGIFGGAGLGAITPSWIRSGGGTKFLGQISNGAINFGANLSNQISSGATRLSMSSGSKKLLWGLLGAFILFFGISLFGGLTETTSPGKAGPLPPPGGGDINTCTFYRGADNPSGLKFRITEWPALINEVATKVGVPASVIAGILRVESGTPFYTDNPDYIKNDYDAHTNGLVYGVMQFYLPTFEGIFNRHKSELQQLFGKTSVTTQIDPQGRMAPASVFRIYSIRDQIIAAAFKIKDDASTNPPYKKSDIEKIVTAYFTQCPYISEGRTYNYCDDVWGSYAGCSVVSGNLASCPLAGQRKITCGSYGSDSIFNDYCNGPQPEDRGHCGRAYGSYKCTPYDRRAHAIDVTATPGETVYLPTIENKPVTWNHLGQYSISPADGGGFGHFFQAIVGGDKWILHLIHTNADLIGFPGGKDHYESGDPVTTIAATTFPHVHVNIGKNPPEANSGPGWLNPEDIGMCTK